MILTESFILFVTFAVSFSIFHIVHFRLGTPKLIIRATALDSSLACLICFLVILSRGESLDARPFLFSLLVSFFLVTIIYAILLPFMAHRSLTVFVLKKVSDTNAQSSEAKIIDYVFREYIRDNHMASTRVSEQIQAGYIERTESGLLKATPRGKRALAIFEICYKILKIKPNF